MFYDIVERKNASTDFIKKKLKKSKNWDFFKGVSPLFWSKIDNFSMFFFWGKTGQGNSFYDILEKKNGFLD